MRFSVLSFTPFLVSVVWSMLGDLCERETWVLGYGNRVKGVYADDEYKPCLADEVQCGRDEADDEQ